MKTREEIEKGYRQLYIRKSASDGFSGFLIVERVEMSFVASWGAGWDHVSVAPIQARLIPTWGQMCKVKDIFFRDNESVIEIHPPKAEYVNNMKNCLHLWRANDKEMVLPPSWMVGIKKDQTMSDLLGEVQNYYEENGYGKATY